MSKSSKKKKELEKENEIGEVSQEEIDHSIKTPKLSSRRTLPLMAKIDEKSSKLLDAMVALDLAKSRSSAAALLIKKAFETDKEQYLKILESYNTIMKAKLKAKREYSKSLENSKEEPEEE